MAVPWGLVVFLVGIAYGYMSPGRNDKSTLFKRGLLYGLILAVIVAIIGFFFNANPLGLADMGFVGIIIAAIVLSLVFIVGVWLGDMIEGRKSPRTGTLRRTQP